MSQPFGEYLNKPSAAVTPLMAKHKGRGKRGSGLVVLRVNKQITLSTLASAAVLDAQLFGGSFTRDFYAISADLMWSIRDATTGEGPLEVGINHGDYTGAEIAQAIVADTFDPGDKIAMEQANRLVRSSGMFPGSATNTTLNDGKYIRTKIKFVVRDGKSLDFWCMNHAAAALTTGAVIEVSGKVYGRWL